MYIETLHLRLPSGLESRAAGIARLAARMLADEPDLPQQSRARIETPALRVRPEAADEEIARAIADAVAAAWRGQP